MYQFPEVSKNMILITILKPGRQACSVDFVPDDLTLRISCFNIYHRRYVHEHSAFFFTAAINVMAFVYIDRVSKKD